CVDFDSDCFAPRGPIEPSPPQLGLAERAPIAISVIVFKDVQNREAYPKRPRKFQGLNKIQVIARRVVLRKASPDASHQTANGEIKPRRTILPLVVAVRGEFKDLSSITLVGKNVLRSPINLSIPPAGFFVVKSPCIADTRQNQTVTDF